MIWLYFVIFIIASVALYIACETLVKIIIRVSGFLNVREFVIAFFVMALATALPNLFLGISSAVNQISQLSFGDVLGNNFIALTLAVSLGILFSKNKEIPTESRVVQTTSIFTFIAAFLPLLLAIDGKISRGDGLILIIAFIAYAYWLFSKQERFRKIIPSQSIEKPVQAVPQFKHFIKDIFVALALIVVIFVAAQGIIFAAQSISTQLGIPLIMVGLLITGLANALPEIYFSINSARRGETWMMLGNLMGSIIFPATLVIGIVSLIQPIIITDFSSIALARFFLIVALVFFFIFSQTDKKLSKKEAFFLLTLYILYCLIEIIKIA